MAFSLGNLAGLVLQCRPMITYRLTLAARAQNYLGFGRGHPPAPSVVKGFLEVGMWYDDLASGSELYTAVGHLWLEACCYFRSSLLVINLHHTQMHSYISSFFDSMLTRSRAHYSNTAKRCFSHHNSCSSPTNRQDAVSLRTATKVCSNLWAQRPISHGYRQVCQSVKGKIYISWSWSRLSHQSP